MSYHMMVTGFCYNIYIVLFTSFCGPCRPFHEKDFLGTLKPRPFPSTYFYAFSGRGATLYEKYHHWLSLSSFLAVSTRKYLQANLVSFMLIKVFEWPFSQYRFNLLHPDWTTNGKEVSHPVQDGRSLLCILLSFFRHRRLPTKKEPPLESSSCFQTL